MLIVIKRSGIPQSQCYVILHAFSVVTLLNFKLRIIATTTGPDYARQI